MYFCRVFYSVKRTRVIVETIHVNFDELPQMASDHVSVDPVPQCPITALKHNNLSPGPQSQENVPIAAGTTLHAYFAAEWIQNQTSVARTPKQNGVVERQNHTLVEAARTMLSAAKVPLFFWAEAIATACFTQNRSLVIPRHEKTPYHIINDQRPSVKFFNIFGCICYIFRDGENLNKMKEKELPQKASDQLCSDPAPKCQTMALNHDSLSPSDVDEFLNGSSKVVSKSSDVSAANALNKCQHHITPLNNHTTPAPTCHVSTLAPTVISSENINQAETYAENDQVSDDEFINIFSTPVQDQGETSSRHVDSSNMHTFYQRYPSEHRWTKDHPLEQVIGNPSQSVRTRRQLESDAEMCMFALTVSRTEPKKSRKPWQILLGLNRCRRNFTSLID
nr:putative ribonuclease H-like domain-containing protein [Tanacetum cinerariifolium]